MKDYRYTVYFKHGKSTISVDVYASCEEAAKILAQAEQIKAGRNWKNIKSIITRE